MLSNSLNGDAPGRHLAHEFVQVSYTEIEKLAIKVKNVGLTSLDKVFTASSQSAQLAASRIAHDHNISYPSFRNIQACIDKKETYELFANHKISIPKTQYIFDKISLVETFKNLNEKNIYYLKSDFSKNPKYIYFGNKDQILNKKINWTKDQFFQKAYILQECFQGHGIRINLYGDNFEIYDFEKNHRLSDKLLDIKLQDCTKINLIS